MPILKIQKEITQEDIVYMSDALGYTPKIQEVTQLENMSMEAFAQLKEENPERKLQISKVITEDNCEVVETVEADNPQSRFDFLAEKTELSELIK